MKKYVGSSEFRNMKKYDENMKTFFQVPGPRGFSNSQVLGGSLEFFQVPEPWRKLEIFLSPRNMKECEEV